jgi:O-succinylbenzoic acid--CoA ligase
MPSVRPRLVALDLPPGRTFTAALDAIVARGDAVLPLEAGAPAAVREAQLAALRPDGIMGADGVEQPLPDPLSTAPGTAVVIATSGSTGAPKGVTLSAAALAASWQGVAARIGAERTDRWLACLPVHHIAGFSVLWRARLSGTDPIVLDGFDLDAVAAALPAVALVSFVPTQLRGVLAAGLELSHLRAVLLGGARVDADLLDAAAAAGARVVTTYGMSETCGGCLYDGVPLDGVEVRLDDAGVIHLRGTVLCSGYRGDPARTAAAIDSDGWFASADLGRWHADGRLQVLGRVDDVIVTGGEKVIAGEVERVVAALGSVADAAVVGHVDPRWGDRVVAIIIPADPLRPPTLAEVRAAVRTALGPVSAPKELHVLAELPRLPTGKVDRLALRQLAVDHRAR